MKFPSLKIKIQKSSLELSPDLQVSSKVPSIVISKLTDNIYLSCFRVANEAALLQSVGITHVLNCAANSDSFSVSESPEFTYLRLPIADNSEKNFNEFVFEATNFISEAINCGGKVLIHCKEGVSRSPMIAVAYLIRCAGLSKDKALQLVQQARPCADIKLAFLLSLEVFERNLLAGNSTEETSDEEFSVTLE